MTFRRLLGFLRPYRVQVIVTTVLAVASQAAVLTIPALTGRAIDATKAHNRHDLFVDAGLIVAAGLLQGVLMFWRRYLAGRLSLAVEYDLRNAMYTHLQRLSFGFYDRHQTGQLMSRATVDLQSVRIFLGYGLVFFSQNIVTVVIVVGVLFDIDWQLALIALAVSPLMMRTAYRYSRVSHPVLKDVQQRVADVTTHAEENIVGVRVVKAFAQEDNERTRFAALAERVFDQAVLAARIQARYVPMLSSLPSLATAAVLLVGGYGVIHGTLTLGAFFAVNGYLVLLVVPLRSAGMWVGQYQRAMASGERIFEVLDVERDIVDRPGAAELRSGPGQIRFESVEFAYEPGQPVLRGIDLEVAAGEHGRPDRPDRVWEDDADGAHPSLLRRVLGTDHRRRRRHPRRHARIAPRRHRHRQPGHVPVLDHRGREHRLRHAGCDARGDHPRRPPSAGARLHASSRTATTRGSASAD